MLPQVILIVAEMCCASLVIGGLYIEGLGLIIEFLVLYCGNKNFVEGSGRSYLIVEGLEYFDW